MDYGKKKPIEIRTEESFRSVVGPIADNNQCQESANQLRVDVGSKIVAGTLIGNIDGVNQNRIITIEGRLPKLRMVTPGIRQTPNTTKPTPNSLQHSIRALHFDPLAGFVLPELPKTMHTNP